MSQSSKHFFSVIIPTLNEEKYLPRLLGDLAKQTARDFEVIVVDGSSHDKTVRCAREFRKQLLLTILTVTASNVSLQRNRGARHARSQYLVFLDADVRIPEHFLLTLKKLLSNTRTDYATTRYRADQETLLDQGLTTIGSGAMQLSALVGKPFFSGQCIVMKTTVFRKLHGFDKSITHAEDCDLVQRAAKAGCVGRMFFETFHTISLRRMRRDGRIATIGKLMYASIYQLVKGPIRETIFAYEMGGQAK
ncbi:MAG: Glycosyl transferase family 2 [Candidatus Gottesmanbacteria bacterium GW2011_GWA1_43_11]|uniref:Glycosyl transferase family 2 n=1 Tax=Candidatus Gottesmanbacteria bacterium GW2011_GWA1_43_11 TaxID=1618436 RepID=A0A0G1EPJ5_9BACT|nr:MAG: Glycosyl transferase family 2 [Candidatus Gottesmanbacteria bacterium GW2011_GWA1_43_11]